ncbi:MAG: hypothetical protein ACYC46_04255 [Acidobacteriaceae bacterium]
MTRRRKSFFPRRRSSSFDKLLAFILIQFAVALFTLGVELFKLFIKCISWLLSTDRSWSAPRSSRSGGPSIPSLSHLPKPADWSTLPTWSREPCVRDISQVTYRSDPKVRIDLAAYSCECEDWRIYRSSLPLLSIGRCCVHLARAITSQKSELLAEWNPITLGLLAACSEHPLPPTFTYRWFSNGVSKFLGLYDISRGYVQLYEAPEMLGAVQYGYDVKRNRWAWGQGPEHPLVVKKELRPWAKAQDLEYCAHQDSFAKNEDIRRAQFASEWREYTLTRTSSRIE